MKTLIRVALLSLISLSGFAQVTESVTSLSVAPSRDGRATYTINSDGSITTRIRVGGVTTAFNIGANGLTRASFSATAPLLYDNSTGIFSMPVATNSVSGYLSSADRTLFNSKEPAITSGSTAQYIRGDKSLSTFITDVRTSLSASGLISYNSTSGALTTNAITGDVAIGANGVTSLLATVNGNVGTFGSSNSVGIFAVNAKGLITSASNVTITPASIGAASTATTLLYDKVSTYAGASNSVTAYATPSAGNAVLLKVGNDENYTGTLNASNQLYLKDDAGSIFKIIMDKVN